MGHCKSFYHFKADENAHHDIMEELSICWILMSLHQSNKAWRKFEFNRSFVGRR